jgi:hypothetical protein
MILAEPDPDCARRTRARVTVRIGQKRAFIAPLQVWISRIAS